MNSKKFKTIFVGTGEFAVPVLERLLLIENIQVTHIITQPDKAAGRKQILKPSPVKEFFKDKNLENKSIKLLQPVKILGVKEAILNTDVVIIASYGQIIPEELLNIKNVIFLNLHGSILPDLRGAVPVHMAILNGYSETGVTLQRMAFKLDTGEIISTKKIQLNSSENSRDLIITLGKLGGEILHEDLVKFLNGNIKPVEQNEALATYCSKEDIAKEKAEIKFSTSIDVAERMIRAFFDWPIAWIKIEGKILKIFKAEIIERNLQNPSLKVFKAGNKLCLNLADGTLWLKEVQLEGKTRMEGKNYFFLAN